MPDWLNGVLLHAARMDGNAAQARFATVTSFDPETHAARLVIQPDGVQTGWVPVGAVSVGNGIGLVAPPSAGDQVIVEPVEGSGDGWVVTGRFWTTRSPVPTSAPTGRPVQSGEIALVTAGAIVHLVGDTVHVEAASIRTKGAWRHEGPVEITGTLTVSDVIRSLTDVVARAVGLLAHRHSGVRGGPDASGPPQQ